MRLDFRDRIATYMRFLSPSGRRGVSDTAGGGGEHRSNGHAGEIDGRGAPGGWFCIGSLRQSCLEGDRREVALMTVASTRVARELLGLANEDERPITPLELIKMTYLAHGWSLGILGEPLVVENAEAWTYGPVFPELYHTLKRFRANPVAEVPESLNEQFDDDDLTEEQLRVIRSVYNSYKKYNGVQLSQMTHRSGTPWSNVRSKRPGSVIKDNIIQRHFEELAEKRNVRRRR